MASVEIVDNPEHFPGDPLREASDVFAGFRYQLLCSLLAWLNLKSDRHLAIEVGEDYQIFNTSGITEVQVKHISKTLTLGSKEAIQAIETYWQRQAIAPLRRLEHVYLTRSSIGIERKKPFGDRPGLAVWVSALDSDEDCREICRFLLSKRTDLPKTLVELLSRQDCDAVRDQLLTRLHWAPNEPSIDEKLVLIKKRIADIVDSSYDESIAQRIYNYLFDFVAGRAARPEPKDRILTPELLGQQIDEARMERFYVTANSSEMQRAFLSDCLSQGTASAQHEWIRRKDHCSRPSFWGVVPFAGDQVPVLIEDVLVAPRYTLQNYLNGIFNSDPVGTDFFRDAKALLEKKHAAAIVGPYGIGKTTLAKALLREFCAANGERIHFHFFRAFDLLDEERDWADAFKGALDSAKTIIVIDGVDELYLADRRPRNLKHLQRNLEKYLANPANYVLLTSRIVSNGQHEEIDYFFQQLIECLSPAFCNDGFSTFLWIKRFNKNSITEWLEKYWGIWSDQKPSACELRYSMLEQCHKGVSEAIKTPLFLYFVASAHYQTEQITSIPNIYRVYQSFVEATVRGKWAKELALGSEPIKSLGFDYGRFLEQLALEIHRDRIRSARMESSRSTEEWELDANESPYLIREDAVSETLGRFLSNLRNRDYAEPDDLYEVVVSNYFLTFADGKWGFRDNNLLNFLVAKRIGCELDRLRKAERQEQASILENIGRIPLERNVVHLLFFWLESQSEASRESIWDAIYQLLVDGAIVHLGENTIGKLSRDKVNCDVLLALVFMRLNRQGLKDLSLDHLPKRLEWLANAGKHLTINIHDIVRTFFQRSHFVHSEFRRLNYKGYNFTQAKITDSGFIQCRLLGAVFRRVSFNDTFFKLCDLENSGFEDIQGSLEFKDCVIDNLRITSAEGSNIKLKFLRCHIRMLHLGGHIVEGEIADSVVEKVVMNSARYNRFVIRDSICSSVEALHAKGIVELICGERMKRPKVRHGDQLKVELCG